MRSKRTRRLYGAAAIAAVALGMATEKANAAYSVNVASNTLTITGDAASDALALRLAPGAPNTLQVDVGDNGSADFSLNRATFTQIVVNAGGGNDTVRINEANGSFTGAEQTSLNGQAGNDVLIGGSKVETLAGGDNNDSMTPGPDDDIASGGNGDDTFIWNPGDGADTIEGQAGADALAFNGSSNAENFFLFPNGARLTFFRDPGAIVIDSNGVERVVVHALGGTDNVTVNRLDGTGVNRVDVDLAKTIGGGAADAQSDTVMVNGSSNSDVIGIAPSAGEANVLSGPTSIFVGHSDPTKDELQVNAFAGTDQMSLAPGVTSLLGLMIDGGMDGDFLAALGSGGADSFQVAVSASPAVDVSSDGGASFAHVLSESIDVLGLGGPDTITAGNGIVATATSLILDGGPGGDQITGSDANDTIVGGDGNDTIRGFRGDDTALMGLGDDTFVWFPGDNNDIVEGQAGTDTLAFGSSGEVNERFELGANGGRLRLTRDIANVLMDTDDVERVDLDPLGGADTITVNPLAGTDVTDVEVDLAGTLGGSQGDGVADAVIVTGTGGPDAVGIDRSSGKARVVSGPTSTVVAHADQALDMLRVDPLAGDDRVSLSSGVTPLIGVFIDGGTELDTVFPTGTSGPDSFQIVAPAPPAVNVSLDGGATAAQVIAETIDVRALAGNDTILGGGGLPAAATELFVEAGAGDDVVMGSTAPDIILGDTGNDTIRGGDGDDVAFMGAGDDTFIWLPGDDNDVVEGQDGADVLDFSGNAASENFELLPNGGRLLMTRNVANVVTDTDEVERVDVHALGGTDNVIVNSMAGTDVSRVDADLAAPGGGGDLVADTVIVNGTAGANVVGVQPIGADVRVSGLTTTFVSHSEPANDKVQLNTFDGNDQVTGAVGLAAKLQLGVDGGIDADTIQGGDGGDTLAGGDGADSIRGNAGNDSLFGGPGPDFLNGGPGADTFSCGTPGEDTLVTDVLDTIGPDC